jgi:hypothetical protein
MACITQIGNSFTMRMAVRFETPVYDPTDDGTAQSQKHL